MKENRWPKKCLKEEARNIVNGNPTSWGKGLEEALRNTGDGEIIKDIWEGKPKEKNSWQTS